MESFVEWERNNAGWGRIGKIPVDGENGKKLTGMWTIFCTPLQSLMCFFYFLLESSVDVNVN